MPFDPVIAEIRFGCGLSPRVAPPASVDAMLSRLAGPDEMAHALPITPYSRAEPSLREQARINRERREGKGTAREAETEAAHDAMRESAQALRRDAFQTSMARGIATGDGLRERLVRFWADHFTATAKNANFRHMIAPYVEEAIRPRVAGRFGDMLFAVATHPVMVHSLDQQRSVGPNSDFGDRRDRGLNENLAREVLELHTLGVDGPYGQDDVRELAELLTGVTMNPQRDDVYLPDRAEPGTETVLGVTYGAEASLEVVRDALADLAVHPATAWHLARKLAVHFVSDTPDDGLVAAMAGAHLATGGDLLAVTRAMLGHEAAWSPERAKVKQPFGYLQSALRALDVPVGTVVGMERRLWGRLFDRPMVVMGQRWEEPEGPDGWAEAAGDWITPQGMAGRITWALETPSRVRDTLPDPRGFVTTALGPDAPAEVVFAAGAAEDVAEGVGIVLASPAFQRR